MSGDLRTQAHPAGTGGATVPPAGRCGLGSLPALPQGRPAATEARAWPRRPVTRMTGEDTGRHLRGRLAWGDTHRTLRGAASCAACTGRRGPRCPSVPASLCRRSPPRTAPGGGAALAQGCRHRPPPHVPRPASQTGGPGARGPGRPGDGGLGAWETRGPGARAGTCPVPLGTSLAGQPRTKRQGGPPPARARGCPGRPSPGAGSGPGRPPPRRSAGWRSSNSLAGRPSGSGTKSWTDVQGPRKAAAWGDSASARAPGLPSTDTHSGR